MMPTACSDKLKSDQFYFDSAVDGGVCTNEQETPDNCGNSTIGCTLELCCSTYQNSTPPGECEFFDVCNRVPTIVYVPDYPIFQPTLDVNDAATFKFSPVANDFIEGGLPGDYLVIDEVFMIEYRYDGVKKFRALPVPLPAPVIDDNVTFPTIDEGNIINWPPSGTCKRVTGMEKFISYTAPAFFTGKASCGYSAKVMRIGGDNKAYQVQPFKTRVQGVSRARNLRSLQAVCPADSTEIGVNPQGVVCCPNGGGGVQGCFIPSVNAAPTDSPTVSPTKNPTTT